MWPKGTQAPRGTGAEGRGAGECSAVRRGHRGARLRGDTSTEVNGTGGCYSGGRERWRRTRKLREATAEAAVGGKHAAPARAPPRGRPGRRRGTAGRSRAEQSRRTEGSMAAATEEGMSREPHRLRRRQRPRSGARRDLPAAHIESFNYAISEGVYRALQVPGGGRGAASGARALELALTRGRPSLAGHSPGGVGAEGQPRGAHRGGGRHLAARGAQGDAVPGGEGVPGRVPGAAQHLPRAADGEPLRSRVCCLTSATASELRLLGKRF